MLRTSHSRFSLVPLLALFLHTSHVQADAWDAEVTEAKTFLKERVCTEKTVKFFETLSERGPFPEEHSAVLWEATIIGLGFYRVNEKCTHAAGLVYAVKQPIPEVHRIQAFTFLLALLSDAPPSQEMYRIVTNAMRAHPASEWPDTFVYGLAYFLAEKKYVLDGWSYGEKVTLSDALYRDEKIKIAVLALHSGRLTSAHQEPLLRFSLQAFNVKKPNLHQEAVAFLALTFSVRTRFPLESEKKLVEALAKESTAMSRSALLLTSGTCPLIPEWKALCNEVDQKIYPFLESAVSDPSRVIISLDLYSPFPPGIRSSLGKIAIEFVQSHRATLPTHVRKALMKKSLQKKVLTNVGSDEERLLVEALKSK